MTLSSASVFASCLLEPSCQLTQPEHPAEASLSAGRPEFTRMTILTVLLCCAQGHDAPKQYSNSTCGVHLTPSTPAASSSAAAERPAKRRRGSDRQPGQDELHASSAGAADHISAETHAMPAIAEEHAESKERELLPLRSAGVNPIDHIFQFHKVRQ